MMKQPNDTKTVDIFAGEKRGRGRPPVANPKSAAERARQYRINKKLRPAVPGPVVEGFQDKVHQLSDGQHQLMSQLYHVREQLVHVEKQNDLLVAERAAAYKEIERLKRDASQKTLPLEAEQAIYSLKAKNKGLNDLLDERDQAVNVLARKLDIALEENQKLKRDALPKLIVPGGRKSVDPAVEAPIKKSSRKSVTKN